MPGVQAIGLELAAVRPSAGQHERRRRRAAPLHEVVERVRAEALELGVEVAGRARRPCSRTRRRGGCGCRAWSFRGSTSRGSSSACSVRDSRREPADRPDRGGSHPVRRLGGRGGGIGRRAGRPRQGADGRGPRARRRRSRGAHVWHQHRLRQVRVRTHSRGVRGGAAAPASAQPCVRRRGALSRRRRPRGDAPPREHAREGVLGSAHLDGRAFSSNA